MLRDRERTACEAGTRLPRNEGRPRPSPPRTWAWERYLPSALPDRGAGATGPATGGAVACAAVAAAGTPKPNGWDAAEQTGGTA
jgi:hypothetical protein